MNQGLGNPLISLVIRPPRSTYPENTGTTLTQNIGGVMTQITNFVVRNSKNEQLKCTFVSPVPIQPAEGQEAAKRPCIVYCHGNAGNKLEGLVAADVIIPAGMDLLSFDFSGCGNSEGQWVTLGWKERDDLRAVLQYLKDQGRTSKVALWGRSMGAATILMHNYADCPIPVACIVLDSSFADFKDVAEDMCGKMGLPAEMLAAILPMVELQIKQVTGGMEIKDLRPVATVPSLTFPALFIHGIDDNLIPMDHTERLFSAYGGAVKDVNYCEGDHNSIRPEETSNQIFTFMQTHFI